MPVPAASIAVVHRGVKILKGRVKIFGRAPKTRGGPKIATLGMLLVASSTSVTVGTWYEVHVNATARNLP